MAIYSFNPNTVPVGENPIGTGFTQRMAAPNTSAIASVTTPIGNRAWSYTVVSAGYVIFSMDSVPVGTTDCEVLVLMRGTGVADQALPGALTRISGAVGSINGYSRILRFWGDPGTAAQRKWTNGVQITANEAVNFVFESGVWYWIKMQSISTTHRAKFWRDGTSEPTAWMLSVTDIDSPYLSGTCGFGDYFNIDSGEAQVAWFSVGTNTDVAPLPPGMDPKTNLVAHWKFDETSGTTANDSANTNHATLTDVTWVAGEIDNAGSFDGITSRGDAPHNATLQIADEVTLSLWMYPTAVGQSSASVLAGKGEVDGRAYSLRWMANQTIRSDLKPNNITNSVFTVATLALNEWHHVAMTWNRLGSGDNRFIYFDGVQVFAGSTTVALAGTEITAERFILGSPFDEASRLNRRFPGYIDDVRVYNRALTPNEISRLATYHQTSGVALTPYVINYLNLLRG